MRTYERPTLHRVGDFTELTDGPEPGRGDVFLPLFLNDFPTT
jgi:hypothetical protein